MVHLINKYCHLYNTFIFKLQEELQNLKEIKLYSIECMVVFYETTQQNTAGLYSRIKETSFNNCNGFSNICIKKYETRIQCETPFTGN